MTLDFDTEKGDDLETLKQRLLEAAAWFEHCQRQPASSFPRSEVIHPSHLETDRKGVVWWVARGRELKAARELSTGPVEGRLLGWSPDETVLDGASEGATDGFFNVEDEPPWDLWLGYVVETGGREYLVCWIPSSLVETAQIGIDVNPVACVDWLPELERELGLQSNPVTE